MSVNQGIGLLFQRDWRSGVGHMKLLLGGVEKFIGSWHNAGHHNNGGENVLHIFHSYIVNFCYLAD